MGNAAEVRLDLDPLQLRGAFLLQQNLAAARQQVERAVMTLTGAEEDAKKALVGKLPAGVDLLRVRFDQVKDEAWAPAALIVTPPPPATPGAAGAAGPAKP